MHRAYKEPKQKVKEAKEQSTQQKKQMQQQFMARIEQNKVHNQTKVNASPQNPTKQTEHTEKKKRRTLEKQLHKHQTQHQVLQENYAVLHRKYQHVKDVLYEEKQEHLALKELVQHLQKENERLQEEKQLLSTELSQASQEPYLRLQQQFEKEKKRWEQKTREYTNAKQKKQQHIQQLQRKIKLLEGIQSAEKPKNQQEKLLHMQRELHFYKRKVSFMEQHASIATLIAQLEQNLSLDTVDQYLVDGKNPFGPLGAEVSKYLKQQKAKEANQKTEALQPEEPAVFGYIGETPDGWVFFDLNYHSYRILNEPIIHPLQEGKPAKALVLNETYVQVCQAFDVEPTEMKTTRHKRKQALHKKEVDEEDYPFFGAYDVLIIGSRNQNGYTKRLEKHGVNVMWHNPFEEGYKRLQGKYQKADVVLVCTRHIPHAVLDHIDKKAKKVALLDRDNEEIVASRLYYVVTHGEPTL